MTILMSKSCWVLIAQALPWCCCVCVFSLPMWVISEVDISKAKYHFWLMIDHFRKSFLFWNLLLKTLLKATSTLVTTVKHWNDQPCLSCVSLYLAPSFTEPQNIFDCDTNSIRMFWNDGETRAKHGSFMTIVCTLRVSPPLSGIRISKSLAADSNQVKAMHLHTFWWYHKYSFGPGT
jgi:hypothetical protein